MSFRILPVTVFPGSGARALPPIGRAATLPRSITVEDWANAKSLTNLPPYPQALQDFLAGDCTIWPGKKRSETHIVVPLFPEVNINGTPVPRTLRSLSQLGIAAGGAGCKFTLYEIPEDVSAEHLFHWGVMTDDVVPGTRNKTYDEQRRLLPAGYEVPHVLDAATAILWAKQHSGIRYFNDNPWTYTRCQEVFASYQVLLGGFTPGGVCVRHCCDDESVGVAGFRKF